MFVRFFALLFTLIACNASAYEYDSAILKIYSKLVPKIIFLSSEKSKIDEHFSLCLIRDEEDTLTSLQLSSVIDDNYPNGINQKKLQIISTNFSKIDACLHANTIFLFNSSERNLLEAILFAKKHTIFSVSYDASTLEMGADISLYIGRKVIPYLNLKAITAKNISLAPALINISKIYSKEQK